MVCCQFSVGYKTNQSDHSSRSLNGKIGEPSADNLNTGIQSVRRKLASPRPTTYETYSQGNRTKPRLTDSRNCNCNKFKWNVDDHKLPPNETDQVQPIDRGLGRHVKIYLGQLLDEWLDDDDNLAKKCKCLRRRRRCAADEIVCVCLRRKRWCAADIGECECVCVCSATGITDRGRGECDARNWPEPVHHRHHHHHCHHHHHHNHGRLGAGKCAATTHEGAGECAD